MILSLHPAQRPSRVTRRSGAAAVEFALIAPLLIVLVFGMIEFGRMFMAEQVLTNAAREGARKAILPGATDDQAQTTIDDYLNSANITGFSRSISPSTTNADGGTAITVTVSVPYSSVSWLPISNFLSGKTLSAKVVMRKEDK